VRGTSQIAPPHSPLHSQACTGEAQPGGPGLVADKSPVVFDQRPRPHQVLGLARAAAAVACSQIRTRSAGVSADRSSAVAAPRALRWPDAAPALGPSALVSRVRSAASRPCCGPPSRRYLSFSEREEIALLRAQESGVREIARRLGRTPSTISRELRRNAATRGGRLAYRASTAQWHAERRGPELLT